MNGILQLTIIQVVLAYIFVLIVLLIIRIRGIKREKDVIWASLRMTIQLVLVGYLLVYIFEHPNPLVTVSIIIVMEIFAVLTIIRKFKKRLSKKLKVQKNYMFIGTPGDHFPHQLTSLGGVRLIL